MLSKIKNSFDRVFKKHAENGTADRQFARAALPIGVVLILSAVLIGLVYYYYPSRVSAPEDEPGIVEAEDTYAPRALDGIEVASEMSNTMPRAIMIENHWESRPPSGLSKASLVFEAPAEAGITRFLAVYDGTVSVDEIGPVRSARDYYIDWAAELNSLFAHVGGSPQALAKIPTANIHDLNQFFNGTYFWRWNERYAPHNVYTNTDLLRDAIDAKGLEDISEYQAWRYKEDRPSEMPGAKEIIIDYSTPEYKTRWVWASDTNEYLRFHDEEQHFDRDGSEIKAKNIIAILTEAHVIDYEGRLKMRTTGKGKAWVFRDGEVMEATWSKPEGDSRLRLYDVTGRDIEMNRGTTWVEVVTSRWKLEWE